jgi:hypothetical protein
MTVYDQRQWGASMPAIRPGAPRQATYIGAWKDLLAILAIAIVVSAALIGGMALGRSAVPVAAGHHVGAHGRAAILFKMRQGSVVRADTSSISRRSAPGRAHLLRPLSGPVARTTQTPHVTGTRRAVPSPGAGVPPFTRFG